MRKRSSKWCLLPLGLVIGFLVACAGRVPDPITLVAGGPTLSGLRRVESAGTELVFVRPGVRMADFSELIVDPFMLSYRILTDEAEGAPRTLDRETEERFTTVVRAAFVEQMKSSRGFRLVDRASPRAIRVQGWLYELELPGETEATGDERDFPICQSNVTVLLTIRHGVTAQPLAEIAERTQLGCHLDSRGYYSTSWENVGKGVGVWARSLRRWLEDLRALPPIEG